MVTQITVEKQLTLIFVEGPNKKLNILTGLRILNFPFPPLYVLPAGVEFTEIHLLIKEKGMLECK